MIGIRKPQLRRPASILHRYLPAFPANRRIPSKYHADRKTRDENRFHGLAHFPPSPAAARLNIMLFAQPQGPLPGPSLSCLLSFTLSRPLPKPVQPVSSSLTVSPHLDPRSPIGIRRRQGSGPSAAADAPKRHGHPLLDNGRCICKAPWPVPRPSTSLHAFSRHLAA